MVFLKILQNNKRNEKALTWPATASSPERSDVSCIQFGGIFPAAYPDLFKIRCRDEKGKLYLEKLYQPNNEDLNHLNFAKNYQDMGVRIPAWQAVSQVFLFAISHLDFLHIHIRSLEGLHIYADPLFEKVLFHLMQKVLGAWCHATKLHSGTPRREDSSSLL